MITVDSLLHQASQEGRVISSVSVYFHYHVNYVFAQIEGERKEYQIPILGGTHDWQNLAAAAYMFASRLARRIGLKESEPIDGMEYRFK